MWWAINRRLLEFKHSQTVKLVSHLKLNKIPFFHSCKLYQLFSCFFILHCTGTDTGAYHRNGTGIKKAVAILICSAPQTDQSSGRSRGFAFVLYKVSQEIFVA